LLAGTVNGPLLSRQGFERVGDCDQGGCTPLAAGFTQSVVLSRRTPAYCRELVILLTYSILTICLSRLFNQAPDAEPRGIRRQETIGY